MTFNFAPWAIDGARSTAGLARLATYAGGGRSGIVQPADLRVSALAVAGNGVRIASGAAAVLNGYMTSPDETYVVSNPAIHTVLPADMPAAIGSVGYYLVCIVIGDPEWDQTGHPFMPAGPLDPEIAADYQYVRVVVIPCNPTTTKVEQLGLTYPAYALARLEIPANTTTITAAMITDLRVLARPRSERKVLVNVAPPSEALNMAAMEDYISWQPYVDVPEWATTAIVTVTMSGFVSFNDASGYLRAFIGPYAGNNLAWGVAGGPDGERREFTLWVGGDISAIAGQSVQLKTQGYREAGAGYITSHTQGAQIIWDVQFDESTI